jgi:hypothetical protein
MGHIFAESLPMTKFTVTLDQAISELKAELAIRSTAYKKWIRDGRMRQETADKKFAAMRSALHVLIEIKQESVEEGGRPGTMNLLDRARAEEGLPDDKPAAGSAQKENL